MSKKKPHWWKESDERMAEATKKVRAIVKEGRCPFCGRGLRQNLAILGWWQCEQFGADQFRKDPKVPHCGWQGFTQ